MRLARDAINVPSPPIFTPHNSSLYSVVNPESSMVAGTLLMIWEQPMDNQISLHVANKEEESCKCSEQEIIHLRKQIPEGNHSNDHYSKKTDSIRKNP